MYLLTLYLPLLSSVVLGLFGRFLGYKGSLYFSIVSMFLCNVVAYLIFYEVCLAGSTCHMTVYEWVHSENLTLHINLYFDEMTAIMLVVITIVSCITQIYSVEYMANDPHRIRFMCYLSLLTLFMMVLVTSGNIIQLFVGREGVGICSYSPINYWYNRIQANKSALPAVITNKISDVALPPSFGVIYANLGSFNIAVIAFADSHSYTPYATCDWDSPWCRIFAADLFVDTYYFDDTTTWQKYLKMVVANDANVMDNNVHQQQFFAVIYGVYEQGTYNPVQRWYAPLQLIGGCLLLGAIGKSAQPGLHIWLPEAMEGPTPVSSLIHAATMVTAGIFLLCRSSRLFVGMPYLLLSTVLIGALTSFFGACIALFVMDIKKVIAYPTCSQLGYLSVSCGMSEYANALYHLFTHASFKALSFLCAGCLIHALHEEQDLRRFGGPYKILPAHYIMLVLGSGALMGMPLLSGFFSKERVLESVYSNLRATDAAVHNHLYFSEPLVSVVVLLSVCYSMRLILYVSYNSYNGYRATIRNVHFASSVTLLALSLPTIPSLSAGYIFSTYFSNLSYTIRNDSGHRCRRDT